MAWLLSRYLLCKTDGRLRILCELDGQLSVCLDHRSNYAYANLADIIFTGSGDDAQDRKTRRDHAAGKLQRLANGIYVRSSGESIETTVLRNWPKIVAHLVRDGVVTDRSGIEAQPWRDRSGGAPAGDAILFMSAPRSRVAISLAGLTIQVRKGTGPVDDDIPYLGTHLASEARRLLDNLASSRARSGPARTLGPAEVERRLDSLCTTHGVRHLNTIRDKARTPERVWKQHYALPAVSLPAVSRALRRNLQASKLRGSREDGRTFARP